MKFKNKSQKKHKSLDESTSEDNIDINNYILKRNSKNKFKKSKNIPSKVYFFNFKTLIPLFLLLISIFSYLLYNIYYKKENIIDIGKTPIKIRESTKKFEYSQYTNLNYDFNISEFNIIKEEDCNGCGFFSYYIFFIGYFIKSISFMNIPIIDVGSYPNIFNNFKPNDSNPWEYFFEQPYNLTLKEINEKARIKNYENTTKYINLIPDYINIFYKKYSLLFYHDVVTKYMPIKKEIMKKVNNIRKKLFNGSQNVLGVLARGTDYITLKKKGTPIPPTAGKMIEDINKYDKENKYDYIFLTTEDNLIRDKFKSEFGKKLKYIEFGIDVKYNYNGQEYFCENKNAQGLEYQKIYLYNIIILSRCIDIISARTHGAAVAFILSEGFRNNLVYDLGEF